LSAIWRTSALTGKVIGQTIENLGGNGIAVENMLADTGYSSSSEIFKYLEEKSITAYIPANARYKPQIEGFDYNKEKDCYVRSKGVELPLKDIKFHHSGNTLGNS
jgi:hypothetical protein